MIFRDFITVEPMPQAIPLAIQQDVQALLWNKDVSFLATEEGMMELVNRRWMKQEAQYLPRKATLGAGVLHWEGRHTQRQSKEAKY